MIDMTNRHEFYMREAIWQAKKGWGRTNPNPLVGCVIVKEDKILARGYHEMIGGAHAEINAINNLDNIELARGATLYVNLEPCAHYGKTPPCANRLSELGLKEVVVGMMDPNDKVCGKGIKILRDAGVEVVTGVLEDECRRLNEIFVKYITKKRPFVVLKSAMTLDGKIATYTGDSKWITSEKSRQYVHRLRDRVAGVMVGINTVLMDDPLLNVRLVPKEGNDAVKIVVDSRGRLPLNSNLVKKMNVILATTSRVCEDEYVGRGIRVIKVDGRDGRVDLVGLMDRLYEMEIDSVLLEGGGTLNASALESGIVDRVITFISPKIVGGEKAKTFVEGRGVEFVKDAIKLVDVHTQMFDDDIMIEGVVECSQV